MKPSTGRLLQAAALILALAGIGGTALAQDKEAVVKNREALMKGQGKERRQRQGLSRWQGGSGASRDERSEPDPVDEKDPRCVSTGIGCDQPRRKIRNQTGDLERLEQISRELRRLLPARQTFCLPPSRAATRRPFKRHSAISGRTAAALATRRSARN